MLGRQLLTSGSLCDKGRKNDVNHRVCLHHLGQVIQGAEGRASAFLSYGNASHRTVTQRSRMSFILRLPQPVGKCDMGRTHVFSSKQVCIFLPF